MCINKLLPPLFLGLIVLYLFPCYAQTVTDEEDWGELIFKAEELECMGKYTEALDVAKRALVVAEKEGDSLNYATALDLVGVLYIYLLDIQNLLNAEYSLSKALKIRQEKLGVNHPEYATSINNLGGYYMMLGSYKQADSLLHKAINIRKIYLEKNDPDYISSLINIGALYFYQGRYNESKKNFTEAFEIVKKYLNVGYSRYCDYINLLNSWGTLYTQTGNYEMAEPLLDSARAAITMLKLEYTIPNSIILNSLANLYNYTGRFTQAKLLYQQSLSIIKNELGETNLYYPQYLNNLAYTYDLMDSILMAETLYQHSAEITKTLLGPNSPNYATSLNNLAVHYRSMKQYKKADSLYQIVLMIRSKLLGEKHPDYAETLNNIAFLKEEMDSLSEAERLYYQASEIFKDQFGKHHPKYAITLNNLAHIYVATNQDKKAEQAFLEANAIIHHNLQRGFIGLIEKEKRQYLQTFGHNFDSYNAFVLYRNVTNPSITTFCYDNILLLKGMLLQSAQELRATVQQSGDPRLDSLFDHWINLQQQIAFLYQKPISLRDADTDSLEAVADQIGKTLDREVSDFRDLTKPVTWDSVQQALGKQKAAVEFIHFNYWNKTTQTDNIIYAALVVRPEDVYPQMVKLFEEKELIEYLTTLPSPNDSPHIYIDKINSFYDKKGKDLYDLIWGPLQSLLENADTIYYAPSGLLHNLSLDALPKTGSQIMAESFHMYRLNSTRSVVNQNQDTVQFATAALFGGINYDADSATVIKVKDQLKLLSTQLTRGYFPPQDEGTAYINLPGSLEEVEQINQYMHDNGVVVNYKTEDEAIEEAVKAVGGKQAPDILHISTHGIFMADTVKELIYSLDVDMGQKQYQFAKDPMNRVGLTMAGANRFSNKDNRSAKIEDGILTGYEISLLDLSKTKLVVLSACETGLGDIVDNEGVYGLQRSFKMAGVDYLLMSLWSVDDLSSKEFMDEFYRQLLANEEQSIRTSYEKVIRTSYEKARDMMRNMNPDEPYYWAPFILVE